MQIDLEKFIFLEGGVENCLCLEISAIWNLEFRMSVTVRRFHLQELKYEDSTVQD